MKKINIIDIAVVVLILALVVFAYLKFGVYEHTKTDAEMNKIQFGIKISEVRGYTGEAFKVGDTLYDSQTKLAIGTITNVEMITSKINTETTDGRIIYVENPERYDVTITVETEGIENDKAYFANKSVELKVGSEKTVETRYVKTTGRIISIESI